MLLFVTLVVLPEKYSSSEARNYLKRRISVRQISVPMEHRELQIL